MTTALTATGFHPDLRPSARLIPRFSISPRLLRLFRFVDSVRRPAKIPAVPGVRISDYRCPARDGRTVRIRLYVPEELRLQAALLWIHGGGYILGRPEQDEGHSIDLCRRLGLVVAAVEYRLSPEFPFPAALDDCFDALAWLVAEASSLGVDPEHIAVGGPSAGAGLAAALALRAHDLDGPPIAFQLLVYPMIDDRTACRDDIDPRRLRLWSPASNRLGWTSYLGREPGDAGVSELAAPARRIELAALPPAWIGVGSCDLFADEACLYARRLEAAGTPCALEIVPGAYHGFDVVAARTGVARCFRDTYFKALERALS
jgi:acetyl esterase/lipase